MRDLVILKGAGVRALLPVALGLAAVLGGCAYKPLKAPCAAGEGVALFADDAAVSTPGVGSLNSGATDVGVKIVPMPRGFARGLHFAGRSSGDTCGPMRPVNGDW